MDDNHDDLLNRKMLESLAPPKFCLENFIIFRVIFQDLTWASIIHSALWKPNLNE